VRIHGLLTPELGSLGTIVKKLIELILVHKRAWIVSNMMLQSIAAIFWSVHKDAVSSNQIWGPNERIVNPSFVSPNGRYLHTRIVSFLELRFKIV
jgi:hypothetical protein